MSATERSGHARWLLLSLAIIVLDQASKLVVLEHLSLHERVTVIAGLFDWTLRYNEGVAFSMLVNGPDWQRYGLSVFALVVAGVFTAWLLRLPKGERWSAMALGLVIGGAIGNAIDRLRLGHVVDFVLVYYRQWEWPAFNVADSAIVVGAIVLVLASFTEHRRKPR